MNNFLCVFSKLNYFKMTGKGASYFGKLRSTSPSLLDHGINCGPENIYLTNYSCLERQHIQFILD